MFTNPLGFSRLHKFFWIRFSRPKLVYYQYFSLNYFFLKGIFSKYPFLVTLLVAFKEWRGGIAHFSKKKCRQTTIAAHEDVDSQNDSEVFNNATKLVE